MKFSIGLCAALVSVVAALPTQNWGHHGCEKLNPFEKQMIKAKNIELYTIPFGATLTNLFVPDKNGKMTDVVLGYDNTHDWYTDAGHPYFGPVVGRYANRIANATFAIDGNVYHTPLNEKAFDTLHGGWTGVDRLNWTITEKTSSSITYLAFSPDGDQGFPGNVHIWVTYSVNDTPEWDIKFKAITDKPTPIMLSNHVYWNLGAYRNSDTVLDQEVEIKASKYIGVDSYLIPTGAIDDVSGAPFLDFTKGKTIGQDIKSADKCGAGCIGYDNAWVFDKPGYGPTQVMYSSADTGIQWEMRTDQVALQMYTCNGQNGSEKIKSDNAGKYKVVPQYGCVVFEAENYIDSINQNWTQAPSAIIRPGEEYTQHTTYVFSTKK